MVKVLCACGNGMGSSVLIKIKVENALKSLKVEGQVSTASISEAKSISDNFDIVICSTYLLDDLKDSKAKVFGIENILDEEQIAAALKKGI